jgi:hypothetical protein
LEKAKNLSPDNQYFIAGQGLLLIKVYAHTHDRQFLIKAEERFLEAARISPYYYLNYVMLSKVTNELGEQGRTQEYLQKLKELCPARYPFLKEELEWASVLASKKRCNSKVIMSPFSKTEMSL